MTNMVQTIALDATGTIHRYTFGAVDEQLPKSIRFGAPAEVKGPPATPMRPVDSPITFKNAQITFYPDGIISAGTVYLTDTDQKTCYALTCGVGSVSFLRAYRYDKGWQLLSDG